MKKIRKEIWLDEDQVEILDWIAKKVENRSTKNLIEKIVNNYTNKLDWNSDKTEVRYLDGSYLSNTYK